VKIESTIRDDDQNVHARNNDHIMKYGAASQCPNVDAIRNAWLCHGCGICKAVCPHDAIGMIYDKRRMNYVTAVDHGKCKECGFCLDVCPGKDVNFHEISKQFLDVNNHDILAGYFIKNYLGWATDKSIRWRAASGGIATALAKHFLEGQMVNKVLVAKSVSDHDPLDFKGSIITDANELYGAMGSKYCSVSLCGALKEITPNDRVAVFGLPCHIHGIRKAQLNNKYFKKLDLILIGIFCGGTRSREATEWLIKRNRFDLKNLTAINYRGNGWPGQLTAEFTAGRKLTLSYPNYSDLQYNGFIPWRCQLCSDGLAELADLSIGDAWLKEISSSNNQGVSMIVIRSQRGDKILNNAIASGVIECKNANKDDAIRSQYKLLLNKKRQILGRMFCARMIGRELPHYDNIYKKLASSSVLSALQEKFVFLIGRFTAKHVFAYKLLKGLRFILEKSKFIAA
jgi:coenzyme F420 hydrogenase subunit beta